MAGSAGATNVMGGAAALAGSAGSGGAEPSVEQPPAIETAGGRLKLEFCADDLVRVAFAKDAAFFTRPSLMAAPKRCPGVHWQGTVVESTEAGGWILLGDVRVDEDVTHCTARLGGGGGEVELRLGDPESGPVLCTFTVPADPGRWSWHDVRVPVIWEHGVRNVVAVFSAPGLRLASLELGCQS